MVHVFELATHFVLLGRQHVGDDLALHPSRLKNAAANQGAANL